MTEINSNWNWGPAFTKLREDVNVLAWLFEEERQIQRLYLESALWALSGIGFSVDEFSAEVGLKHSAQVTTNDPEQSEKVSLDGSVQGKVSGGNPDSYRVEKCESPPP